MLILKWKAKKDGFVIFVIILIMKIELNVIDAKEIKVLKLINKKNVIIIIKI